MSFAAGKLTDQQLVGAYLAGHQRAFSEIVMRHQRNLLWVARRYGRNEEDALDILQEALLRASQNLHQYRCESGLGAWLHRVVANSGYDFIHHRHQREIAVVDEQLATGTLLFSETSRRDLDLILVLRAALARLKPEHAAALVLIDAIGYTVAHAGTMLGVPGGTIKSRRSRAKAALRAELGEDYFSWRS